MREGGNRKIGRNLIILVAILVFSPFYPFCQNAPKTTAATVNNALPGAVSVPITVIDFNSIGAISLSLDYEYSVVHFTQAVKNPLLPGTFNYSDADLGNGKHRITLSWFGNGVTLTNGSTIFTLTFTFISGITTLGWFDNGGSCQYSNSSFVILNDLPTSSYYFDGYICGGIGNPGVITGSNSVCKGQTAVPYSIAPLLNATSYNWTVPSGATIATGSGTNAITVDYSNNAVSGNITVQGVNVCGAGPLSQLPVTVNPLPAANAGSDTTIPYGTWTTLHAASGGSGSFSYHWSPEYLFVNPNVQHPQTVNLYSTTIFTLMVANLSTLCQQNDNVTVAISGGPLTVNPTASPNAICIGQNSQLAANAGGGSGNYTYQWTSNPPGNPPWSSNLANPLVTPEISTQYLLTASDGFNSTSNSTNVIVFELPTAAISGGDTLCDDGSTAVISVDLTGSPPWTFIYTDGVNSFTISDQTSTPWILETSEAGIYTLFFVEDMNCTGTTSGSAPIIVFPVPSTPQITLLGDELHSDICCGNQWYLDGIAIPGANDQSYTPFSSGTYFDIIQSDGCFSDSSNAIYVVITGLDNEQDLSSILLYPNPARDFVDLHYHPVESTISGIRITDPRGIIIRGYTFDIISTMVPLRINVQGINPGFYLVEIIAGYQHYIRKIIIN